ncbi:hypothetical protein IPZ58_07590 [Streptomyces roseoverticillatus]|uniref:hypothetical protein n=1 Tax=Streptomyces roseoverticillatus TaxID=66429 RepID=UPI001F1E96CE|nr:hypothetical protein [Streptomyces roseoverticillatus]MCF3101442.1 hypothetical protein [Streptomyces roseoverticillatus]
MKNYLPKIKSRMVWWACHTFIGAAAAGITGWSLYVIARHYGVPKFLALGTAAVFDGAAMACLYLAGQAVRERRSALGPLLATLGMASVSVYLNKLHADLIHGGRGAFLLFAMPTVVLLILAGLSWSAQRARLRAQDGDIPAALPRLGFWGWLLATEEAWKRTKDQVEAHVTGTERTAARQAPKKPRKAADAIREHFAGMDPIAAIRMAHEAKPHVPPAELAAELKLYGLTVSAVDVAFVLGHQPPATTIDRPDAVRTTPDTLPPLPPAKPLTGADILSAPLDSTAHAARQLIALGITDKAKAVPLIINALGLDHQRQGDSVRRAFEREIGKSKDRDQPDGQQLALDDGIGQGGGGYA